jgi:hypothetical protein
MKQESLHCNRVYTVKEFDYNDITLRRIEYNNKNYTKNSIKNLIFNNTIKLPSDFYKAALIFHSLINLYLY